MDTQSNRIRVHTAGSIKRVLSHLAALLCGAATFVVSFGIVTIALRFLGSIPFLRSILFYPSDAAWALIVLPPSAACFAAVWIAEKISRSVRPISAVIALFWLVNIAAIFLMHNFTWQEFLQSIAGIICAGIFLFQE